MKKLTCWLLSLVGLMGGLALAVQPMQAADQKTNAEIKYSVNKLNPGKEVDASSSFYDLKVKAGQTRKIRARVYNATNQKITVKTKLLTTFTNDSGQIAYTQMAKTFDPSLQYRFDKIATLTKGSERVTIPAKGNRVVSATIKVPAGFDDGVILGSWYFEKTNQTPKQSGKGININHKYSYALAVKLTTKEITEPKLALGKVTPGLKNYRKVVEATIRNVEPAVVSKLKVKTTVTKRGSQEVLYRNTSDNLIMAPNSAFKYPTFLDKSPMKAGQYTLNMTATTKDSKWDKQTWHWQRHFTITADQARQSNRQAKNDPDAPISIWWYVAAVIGIMILTGGIVYLVMKRKRT
ncbi:DUF916 and DUF3324 domain-containing protein [Lactiplantibacillus mudanjiangensis]|uniref:Cell surface protein [Lactobacillus plantarum JDM1] n=1 Tax=Lactiplantibacillus mudanjiangensis TaxID=1296538 RepID=A0A660DWN3_9LACO|nr:DUF916 and DUF3324 domain-containing protein [Lactiplantibacillus mudanjiangensis]VDG25556.1 cell surface protein precursor [Lactobacillus plantarum JDM1] [Lactiplantibacillus mudanjiangensis]VDG28135.1 cell surface protein precursor [Lactobacillus plantarum JDM1] [Lactiplantibacillus mudanjiangensis]VDG30957.1 cell surface protein precursor [Lactobacillus plantarum JDM1] [Lactiplantibacillus mudanjiangensis]